MGCEPPFEPILQQERRVLLHSILDMSADTQRVMLEWTRTSPFESVAIVNAAVTLTAPNGQTVAMTMRPNIAPDPGNPARYILLLSENLQTLQRGGAYQLTVNVPGHPTITGTTVMPDTIATTTVLTRTLPFSHDLDTLRMQWPRVRGAAGYRVMSSPRHPLSSDRFFTTMGIFTDTSVVLPGDFETLDGGFFFPREFISHIVALAVDDNYFTYYKTATDPCAGAPPSRLTGGAVGVFGSIVPIVRHRFQVQ